MPQSLQSLLLAKMSAAAATATSTFPSSKREDGASIPDSFDSRSCDDQFYPLSDLGEKELNGSSEMVYDVNLCSREAALDLSLEGLMDASSKFESEPDYVADLLTDNAKTIESNSDDDANTLWIKNENEALKIQIQEHLGKIASLEIASMEFASMRDELDRKRNELDDMKLNFRRIKQEDDVSHHKLLEDNLSLRTAQTDNAASIYTAEKKCIALEAMRLGLINKIENLEEQVKEVTNMSRKTSENLVVVERQRSHLDSENILLRQLRVDLDSATLNSSHQQRQIAKLETEVSNLRKENTQLRQKLLIGMGISGGTDLNGTSGSQPHPSSLSQKISASALSARPPPARYDRDRDFDSWTEAELHSRPPLYSIENAIGNQQQQPVIYASKASKSLAAYASSGSAEMKVPHTDTKYDSTSGYRNDSSSGVVHKNCDQDSQRERTMSAPVAASLTVRSLADLVGNRRSTVGETSGRNSSDNSYRRGSDIPSSSGAHESNRNNWVSKSFSGTDGTIQTSSASLTSHDTSSRISLDGRNNSRRNNSGGGVSSFYDDSSDPTFRAPFGTAQSAADNMVSFEDTEKKLTALMTEKSVLYEESARLSQRGGKILKDRARLQHVDARLIEVGKEIAWERKKLSGKPG